MQPAPEPNGPFPIYVPNGNPRSLADIIRGSAIVGFPLETDPSTIHIYFEGNRFQVESMRRFADRAQFAAGRCRWFRLDIEEWQREHPDRPIPTTEYGYVSYPTSSQGFVPPADLQEVGSYDDVLGIVTPTSSEHNQLLCAWIGSDDPLEYLASGAVYEGRRRAITGDGLSAE